MQSVSSASKMKPLQLSLSTLLINTTPSITSSPSLTSTSLTATLKFIKWESITFITHRQRRHPQLLRCLLKPFTKLIKNISKSAAAKPNAVKVDEKPKDDKPLTNIEAFRKLYREAIIAQQNELVSQPPSISELSPTSESPTSESPTSESSILALSPTSASPTSASPISASPTSESSPISESPSLQQAPASQHASIQSAETEQLSLSDDPAEYVTYQTPSGEQNSKIKHSNPLIRCIIGELMSVHTSVTNKQENLVNMMTTLKTTHLRFKFRTFRQFAFDSIKSVSEVNREINDSLTQADTIEEILDSIAMLWPRHNEALSVHETHISEKQFNSQLKGFYEHHKRILNGHTTYVDVIDITSTSVILHIRLNLILDRLRSKNDGTIDRKKLDTAIQVLGTYGRNETLE
ncbi:hypothetical protein CANMA_005105 [Candida margitis]|uniref:uncharacterized protein n=1 Tax=Candida margitis TaxID=1775924 RepID=UPI002226D525|nr:uncharacterized protein CANMA_005105 [Candida margitis]KAI5952118.1 hypothetical protein CANMA_005105 [Candida margitis]